MDKKKKRRQTIDRYNRCQFLASIFVALFITNFALCLLVMNQKVLKKYVGAQGKEVQENEISDFEKELVFDQLSEQFRSFFKGDYKLAGYELTGENTDKLNKLKAVYRISWIVSVLSFGGAVYSFMILSKRRLYMPLLYGGLSAALLTSFHACLMLFLKTETAQGIKKMVIYEDYSFFGGEDILKLLFTGNYARLLFLLYLLLVFALIMIMVLIRMFIIYCGRPHKF